MTTGYLAPVFGAGAQVFDNQGNVLSGGKIYVYTAGTTTPETTWSDLGLTTPNTNPLVLQSSGRLATEVWFSATVVYKFVLKDSNNNVLGTWDNISGIGSPTPSSANVTFLPSGSGAVVTTVQDYLRFLQLAAVNIQGPPYYARPDAGVTNNFAAFAAATTYCQDNLKPLYIPGSDPSKYYGIIASGGVGWSITKPLTVITDGAFNTIVNVSGLIAGQYAIDIDGTAYGTYENGNFGAMSIYAGLGDCVCVKNVSNSEFGKFAFVTGRHGLVYTGTRTYSNDFHKLTNVGLTGQTVRFIAHTGGGQHNFWGGSLGGDTGLFMDSTTNVDDVNFHGTNWEQCASNSMFVQAYVKALNIFGGRAEGCNGVDFLIDPAGGNAVLAFNVLGAAFDASDNATSNRIQFGSTGGGIVKAFNVKGCHVRHSANVFQGNLVSLNSTGETGTIANNFLDGTLAGCKPVDVIRAGVEVYNNLANNGVFGPQAFTFTDGSGAALTLALSSAQYTMGRGVLSWQAVVTYPATASGVAAGLVGLPFPVLAGTSQCGRSGAVCHVTDAGVAVGVFQALPTTSGIAFYNPITLAALTNANLSGKTLYLSGSYAV